MYSPGGTPPFIRLPFADCLEVDVFKMDMYDYCYHYSLSVNFCFSNWTAN